MRVLMTADAVGGVWNYALDLSAALGDMGVEVTLATMGPPPSEEQRRAAARVSGLDLRSGTYRLEWMDDPWADVDLAGDWLLRLAEEVRPDIVHLNGYALAALPWPAPTVVVAHSCVLSWWRALKREPLPARYAEYARRVSAGLAAARAVIAPTRWMLGELARCYPSFRGGHVIPNGRATAALQPATKEPFVFAAGRVWDDAKNIDALGRVADELAWPVFIAGPLAPPHGAVATGGDTGATLLGELGSADVAAWLARASVYALPAKYEPFGLSALEAARAGCALVLGDVPSLREVWADAAVFVDPTDPAEIRDGIRTVIRNPLLRTRMAARARARARRYGADLMARRYREVYARLADRFRAAEVFTCAS